MVTKKNVLKKGEIAKFSSWRKRQLETISAKEQTLIARLRARVPKSLERLFDEDVDIIPNLVQHLFAGRKYHTGEGYAYGYKSIVELKRKLHGLQRAWLGVVTISYSTSAGGHKLDVTFKAFG